MAILLIRLPLYAAALATVAPTSSSSPLDGHPVSDTLTVRLVLGSTTPALGSNSTYGSDTLPGLAL
nr:unnamed protein product [Digitaria exilis]